MIRLILLLLILFPLKSEAVTGSILLAADREIKEQALREHPLYQESIGLALQAAHHRNVLEEQARAKGIHSVKAHSGDGHSVEKEKLQKEAYRVKEEVLSPLRKIFEAPSTSRGTEKAKAFFSGMGESVKDTLELPLVLGKFGITAAESLATWEDKLGLKSAYEGVKELFSEAKKDWEDDDAYQARQKAAREYKVKAQAYEKAFNAAHYHNDQAKTAGDLSAEALQFVFGSEIFKAGAQGVKAAGMAGKGVNRIITNTEKFIEDAIKADRNGLSKVGRALQKHSSREGSCFKDMVFSHTDADKVGERILREILNVKNKDIHFEFPKNGCIEIYDKITGRGIGISRNKEFNGFREFKNIPK